MSNKITQEEKQELRYEKDAYDADHQTWTETENQQYKLVNRINTETKEKLQKLAENNKNEH